MKAPNLCQTKFCRGRTRKYIRPNGKITYSKICSNCQRKALAENDTVRYCFYYTRGNAQRRRISFELSLTDFRAWCIKTDYIKLKGKTTGNFSIDRIDPRRGYCLENIQLMEFGANCRKAAIDRKIYGAEIPLSKLPIRKNEPFF